MAIRTVFGLFFLQKSVTSFTFIFKLLNNFTKIIILNLRTHPFIGFLKLFFFFLPCSMVCGILIPDQRSNPSPWHHRSLCHWITREFPNSFKKAFFQKSTQTTVYNVHLDWICPSNFLLCQCNSTSQGLIQQSRTLVFFFPPIVVVLEY